MNEKIRKSIFAHPRLIGTALNIANAINPANRTKERGKNNKIITATVFRNHCRIEIYGNSNTIEIEEYTRLINTKIYVNGNNNCIHIGKRCYLNEADLYIEDSSNTITIGNHTSVHGTTQFAAIEGTAITIGEDCMFSKDINVRTGDGHTIVDADGHRINESKDITIGNHCWIGMRSIIMKGASIGSNSIVGAGTIVTKHSLCEKNCIMAGIPARIIMHSTNWERERRAK